MTARPFTFGRNWKRFLRSYTPARQKIAEDKLRDFLGLKDLKGKTFLDIGSGSGIHSAAAWLMGAERVLSFDYDPDSVAATRQLWAHLGSPDNWTVLQGSVLDAAFMRSLGVFDIVYSWGVLHHTGDQWSALKNAISAMNDQARLYIALYASETQFPSCDYWIDVKQRYNKASGARKRMMEAHYIWTRVMGRQWLHIGSLIKTMWRYRQNRGMDFMTDVRDWLGGWPIEFSSVPEVMDFAKKTGDLTLVNLTTGGANSEFLFVRNVASQELGCAPVDLAKHPYSLPTIDDPTFSTKQSVWIFGAARGGEMIYTALTKRGISVAGFIDPTPARPYLYSLPVLSFEVFASSHAPETPVVLASQYVAANARRLHAANFHAIYNAHPTILRLMSR